MRNLFWTLGILLLGAASAGKGQGIATDAACLTLKGARLETAADVARAQGACEIDGPLAVFTEGVKEITFPNLKRVKLINIEADDLEAIAFPALEHVDSLYISGGDLKIAELPRLKHASTLYVKSKNLQFLHLPSLRKVWKLYITKNPNLEAVFADKLYDIGVLQIDGNPKLHPGNVEMLQGVTRTYSPEERKAILEAEQNIRELKLRLAEQQRAAQPPMPPTGHPVSFGSIGFYQAYPHYFWNYWNRIGAYGYHGFYHHWRWW